eukprot:scaffold659_cov329-Prasinococcus_capsulatus_cf.AAC.8
MEPLLLQLVRKVLHPDHPLPCVTTNPGVTNIRVLVVFIDHRVCVCCVVERAHPQRFCRRDVVLVVVLPKEVLPRYPAVALVHRVGVRRQLLRAVACAASGAEQPGPALSRRRRICRELRAAGGVPGMRCHRRYSRAVVSPSWLTYARACA